MEAKDTVMNDKQISKIAKPFLCGLSSSFDIIKPYLISQAEISFNAGKQEERREVVEWLRKHNQYPYNVVTLERMPPHGNEGLGIKCEDWQAKLKEWGIE